MQIKLFFKVLYKLVCCYSVYAQIDGSTYFNVLCLEEVALCNYLLVYLLYL